MANEITLPVDASTLPSGFCPGSYQELLNQFSAHQSVTLPTSGGGGVTVSATKPSDQTIPWLQLDSLGRPVRVYWFAQGAWLSLHPQVPGQTIMWTSTLPTFSTFDGGDGNPVSAITGPMWEQVTAVNGRYPIGVGTMPGGEVVAIGATGGSDSETVPLPAHVHSVEFKGGGGSGADAIAHTNDDAGTFSKDTGSAGVSSPTVDIIPPYYGIYLLKRTNRLFYTVV